MKKTSYRRLLLMIVPIFIISVIILVAFIINKNNDSKGIFSVIEKRWIEKNSSETIDISITNDLPVFGKKGEGVFFDYLEAFTKENDIKFNMLPYSKDKKPSNTSYYFEVNNKSNLSDDELLFYRDNYVLISKDNTKIKDISELSGKTIATLESDLNTVKDYFFDNEQIYYNSYATMDSLITALNQNDVSYAMIPKLLNIEDIFSNNYYIVYNASELFNNYVLKVNGDNKVLNSILKKTGLK